MISKTITKIEQIESIPKKDKTMLESVTKKFAFRATPHYLSLINWSNPNDPIKKIIIPNIDELKDWGDLDPSCESKYSVIPGLEHKYSDSALMLVSDTCEGICRYCFRKRIFMDENDEVQKNIHSRIQYIKDHSSINNVILSGGDPLILSTRRLEELISNLATIDHVKTIRIGSKSLAFNPKRVTHDPHFTKMLSKYSKIKRIYLMAHFDHPVEITSTASEAIEMIQDAGAITLNQHPIIRGVNDNPSILKELYSKLIENKVSPYYTLICRPTKGNEPYVVPIEESFEIFNEAQKELSGITKTAKLVMSHKSGKIEILGLDNQNIYFKYHRPANPEDTGKIMIFPKNPQAYWFDDYKNTTK
jgi:KamA family protein